MDLVTKTKSVAKQFRERHDRWFPPDWNQTENRPRAWARILGSAFPIAVVLIVLGILAPIVSVIGGFLPISGLTDSLVGKILIALFTNQILGSAAIAVGICLSGWVIGCRYLHDFGLEWSLKWVGNFFFGFIVGIVIYSGVIFVAFFAGWLTFTDMFSGLAGRVPIFWFITVFVSALCIGVREELIFRSLLLTNTAEGFRGFDQFNDTMAVGIAVLISSFGFILWHGGISVSNVAFFGAFGLLFGIVYAWTQSVAIPIGLHTGWDLAYGRFYGTASASNSNILETSVHGPALFVGGSNWIGLLSIFAVFVGLVIIACWVYIREGELRVRSDIAVPDLHDNRKFWNVVHNPKRHVPFWNDED